MTTVAVTIDATRPGGQPVANQTVLVTLIDGGAGGSTGSSVILSTDEIKLDATGRATVPLTRNDEILPLGTFYRVTVQGALPHVTRSIALTAATPSAINWANESVAVISPVPPSYASATASVLTDANGGRWRLTVSTTGVLSLVSLDLAARPLDRFFSVGHSYSVGVGATVAGTEGMQDRLAAALTMPNDVVDSFDRGDIGISLVEAFTAKPVSAVSLGTMTDGQSWTTVSGVMGTDANGAYIVSGSPAVSTFTAPQTDGAMKIVNSSAYASGDDFGFLIKYVDASNYIWLDCNTQFGTAAIRKVVAGASSVVLASITWGVSGTVMVSWSGSSTAGGLVIKAWREGIYKGSGTVNDAVFDAATKCGMRWVSSAPGNANRIRSLEWFTPQTTLGNGWANANGSTWRIVNGAATCFATDTVSTTHTNITTRDMGFADGEITVVMGEQATTSTCIVARYVDPNNYLYLTFSTLGWSWNKRIAGVNTAIFTAGGPGTPGTVVKVQLLGNRVRIWNGTGWVASGTAPGAIDYQLLTDTTPLINSTMHGLGYVASSAIPSPAIASFTFRRFWNFGRGGQRAALVPDSIDGQGGTIPTVLQRLPRLGTNDLAAFVWGKNDDIFGPTEWADNYARGIHVAVGRALAASVYESATATVTGTWSTVTTTLENSGTGYRRTAVAGSTASFAIPSTFAGGRVCVGTIGRRGNIGGIATIAIDGVTVATVNTSSVWSGTGPESTNLLTRIDDVTAGAHTVLITVTSVAGNFDLDYVSTVLPNSSAPVVLVYDDPRVPVSPEHECSAGSSTTATIEGASLVTDIYVGRAVKIIAGTGVGQIGHVTANTATVLTVANQGGSDTWTTGGDATSRIKVYGTTGAAAIWGGTTDADIAVFNAAVDGVVAAWAGWPVLKVPMDSVLDDLPENFSADLVHPSTTGHQRVADAALSAVVSIGAS